MEIIRAAATAAAGIDAPAGIQFIPGPPNPGSGDYSLVTTLFTDTTGAPTRIVVVSSLSTTTVSVIEYKLLSNVWVFDPADCARDASVTLNFTLAFQTSTTAFAMDDPAGTGDRIVFIAGNDDQSTDTFEIDSIVLTPGGTSLTATAVVIAGANQPTNSVNMSTCNIPLTTTRVMTFFRDDAHFADITETTGTYTFTYTDAKVLAVDTSIGVDAADGRRYSGITIGGQVCLLKSSNIITTCVLWEMSTAAVLTEEFNPFVIGALGSEQTQVSGAYAAITAIGGSFAAASSHSGAGATGDPSAYFVTTFPLDDI